jgi:pilus assembly protein FimV
MFSRSIGFVVSIAVLWFPLSSFALGLGDLTVESRLASPLNARVVVNGIDRVNLDPELLIIKLDSKISTSTPRLFHRLERSGSDSTAIIIYTRTAVMAPIFEFRLLVEWDNGSIARNYDVLIDPPSYEVETAASSVVPSQTDQASITEEQISVVEPASTTTDSTLLPKLPDETDGLATVARKSSINKGQTYGPTVSGNSLWRVARNVKSDNESLSMYQWMHRIWDENPDAFTGLNMHRLRVNALLRVPLEQDVFKISHKLAYQLYAEHLAILQSAQAKKSKLAVNTVVVEAEQPLLEPGQTLAVEVLQENIEEEVAAEVSSASVEAVVPENSAPVTEAIGAPDQNEVIYDLLAIAEIEGQQTAEAELIETAKNSDDIDNLAQGDDLVTGTAQGDDLIQAVVSITAETPVSGNVADSEVSDSAGSNDAFGFIANSVRGLRDRVSAISSWVSMILGAMLMLLFVGLVRMLRSNAEPVGSDPVRADIIAQRPAVEAGESSTLLSDINGDITRAREDLSDADEPAVGAVVDVKGLLVEAADVLVAYGNTEGAVTMLLEAIERHPSEAELGLHLLRVYYMDRNAKSFERQFRTLSSVITSLDESEQVLWRGKLSDLCPESPLIAGNGVSPGITAKDTVDSAQTFELQAKEDYLDLDVTEHTDVTETPNTEAVEIRSELEEDAVPVSYETTELLTMDIGEINIDWGIPEKTSDNSQPVSDSSDTQKPTKITSDDEQSSEGSNVGALEDSEIIADAIEQIDVVEPTSQINMSEDTLEFFGFADDEPKLELRDTGNSDVDTIESAYAAEIDNTADTALIDQLKSEANTVAMEARTSEIEISDYDDSNTDRTVEVYQTAATNHEDLSEEVGDTLSFIEEVDSSSKLPDEVPGLTDVDGEELAEKGTDPYLRPVNGRVLHFPESANQKEDKANEFEAQIMHTLQAMRDQVQQMNERLFSQERENQRLRKALEDLNSDASIDKRDKA